MVTRLAAVLPIVGASVGITLEVYVASQGVTADVVAAAVVSAAHVH